MKSAVSFASESSLFSIFIFFLLEDFVDIFRWVEILGYFSELEVVHHVIFIGESGWRRRLKLASVQRFFFLLYYRAFVNKCRLFSIWSCRAKEVVWQFA